MTTAWFVLALGENREHAGNDGYDDSPTEHYRWDSTVPNHARLAVGDVIALWDKQGLIGLSVISAIDTGTAEKWIYFCRNCEKSGGLKRRLRDTPAYRCNKCLALFDEPIRRRKTVTTYMSHHGEVWMDCRGLLSAAELRAMCDSPKSQLSMRPARWEKLRDALLATEEAGAMSDLEPGSWSGVPGGHKAATVRVRVGQDAFRKNLLKEHGETCAFTGPAPAAALEAAHLYSYADSGEHHEWGGLLFRRDVHTLFDRGLLAVCPDTGLIDVADELHAYPVYAQLHGRRTAVELRPEHSVWLAAHWRIHRTDA
ncbi:HNH endonuclease [Streptomyces sp. bgisy082]|uniref:HNH endonuclease n=1 Tax=Streptomyces sp. bgisy082 TaxID=3413776 RepID=UPI003D74388D